MAINSVTRLTTNHTLNQLLHKYGYLHYFRVLHNNHRRRIPLRRPLISADTVSVFNFEDLNFRGWREHDNFNGLYFCG